MREIEFRGKRIDNGEWVCGYLVMDTDTKRAYIVTKSYWGCEDCSDQTLYYEVIPETVGQYTGRKDKNGVKIYEGGIVTNKVFRATVECEPDLAGFYPFACEIKTMYVDECEVIGNIHDNPELRGAE